MKFSITTNNILKGSIIALIVFIFIESYYAYYYQDLAIYGAVLGVVSLVAVILACLCNLDKSEEDNRRIYEYIIIVLLIVLIIHPLIINYYFPNHEASVFKSSCVKMDSYSELNDTNKNYEGQKVLLEGKIESSTDIRGTYLFVFFVNREPKNVAAVFYNKEPNWNANDTVLVYGVVTAKRPLKEFFDNDGVNVTYPSIFAFHIDKKS